MKTALISLFSAPTRPEKLEKGGFTLETHTFSVHTLIEENWGRKNQIIVVITSV